MQNNLCLPRPAFNDNKQRASNETFSTTQKTFATRNAMHVRRFGQSHGQSRHLNILQKSIYTAMPQPQMHAKIKNQQSESGVK